MVLVVEERLVLVVEEAASDERGCGGYQLEKKKDRRKERVEYFLQKKK